MTAGRPELSAHKSIVLVGFMGAGKSRIGRLLAGRLRLPFVDTDTAIEETYRLSIADIFRQCGEAEFREAERRLIAHLIGEGPKVIALGGGAFIDAKNRDTLNRAALTIWLDAPLQLILSRLKRSTTRPLASNRSEDELRELCDDRRQYYAQAHLRIETRDSNPSRIVDQIVGELGRTDGI
jgi:shikimate kinase